VLVKLLDLKEFITKKLSISSRIDWVWVKLYVDAFKDPYDVTQKLQKVQLLYILDGAEVKM